MKDRKITLAALPRIHRSKGQLESEISEENLTIARNTLMRRTNSSDQVMTAGLGKSGRIQEPSRRPV